MTNIYKNSYKSVLTVPEDEKSGLIVISSGNYTTSDTEKIKFPVIFTDFSVSFSEKVQVTTAFAEHTHIYAFGKDVGRAILTGVICNQDADFLFSDFKSNYLDLYEKIRAYTAAKTGNFLKISGPGNCAMKTISQGTQFNLSGNSYNVIKFSLDLIIISFIGSPPATMLGV